MELRKISDMGLESRKKENSDKINWQKIRPLMIAIGIVLFSIAFIIGIRRYG